MHGFSLISETEISELSSTARLWRHDATGAELLSFCNADENKVFGVSFCTPPFDSSGVAHILEHSVLCGSRKYPVREPFVELLKGSLQTFLNAFTYPDKTCYPVASANLADFYNLMDVYLDAVFFPRISEDIFAQEGHHLEAEDKASPLFRKGVVYNEMKGAFSAPESVLGRWSLHSLFPDSVYALESGGDPKAIPSLTYEAFVDFHKRCYHPANALFYFWGNDPEEERLRRTAEAIAPFGRGERPARIARPAVGTAPRQVRVPFAAGEDDKALVTVNWPGPDVLEDMEAALELRILEHILLGLPASPLRRALLESGLGEDLAGQGLEAELRLPAFDMGLKGVESARVLEVEALILARLADLAEGGVPAQSVEAAVNSVEFSLRENNTGRFPVGLSVMLRCLTTWLYGGDPFLPLRFEAPLARLKARLAQGEPVFEQLIRRLFLENPGRVTVILEPDNDLAARQEEEERAELAEKAAAMGSAERAAVAGRTKELLALQATPDSPQALAAIPRLQVADLPAENLHIPTLDAEAGGAPLLFHPLPTSGIAYVEAAFEAGFLSPDELALLPLLGRAMTEMGTAKRDFIALNMAVAAKTGGLDAAPVALSHADDGRAVVRLVFSGKAAPDKTVDLFNLLGEMLLEPDFSDLGLLRSMVLEDKAGMEHGLVPSGHQAVAGRLKASLCAAGAATEHMNGLEQLFFLRRLAGELEREPQAVRLRLENLRRALILRGGLTLNVTALPDQQESLRALAGALAASLPVGAAPALSDVPLVVAPPAEALLLPAQVNYVGRGVNLAGLQAARHGSTAVILKHLRTGYLWEKVRVQGGAYGCVCGLDRLSGAFFLASYRDPNVAATLKVYEELPLWLQRNNLSKFELDTAIIGAVGELDTYLLPDAKGSTALARRLQNDTEEGRAQLRREIFATTPDHFREFGKALEKLNDQGRTCVLGGQTLEREATKGDWTILRVL